MQFPGIVAQAVLGTFFAAGVTLAAYKIFNIRVTPKFQKIVIIATIAFAVAMLLNFGLSKVKMKIATGELRSVKDGKYRRILPEWVDQYVQDQVDRQEAA